MITYSIWKDMLGECYCYNYYDVDYIVVAFLVFASLFIVPLDILLLPFEILVYIIRKILLIILNKEYRR